MLKIKLDTFDVTASGKILKNQDYASIVSAKTLVSVAKKEQVTILKAAHEEYDKIIADAKKNAEKIVHDAQTTYESEKRRGYEDGLASGKAEMADQLMDLATKSADSFTKLEHDIVEVVIRAIKKILGDVDKGELITNVVKNSLKMIKSQKQVVLKVSTLEAAFLRERVSTLIKDSPGIEFLDIISDNHLSPGSCLLETELGVIDASIDVQIAAIEKSLGKDIHEQR